MTSCTKNESNPFSAGRLPSDGGLAIQVKKGKTDRSIEHALIETARHYRKALWADAEAYVEIWLEKKCLRRDGRCKRETYLAEVN